jgi:hypothetical protein
MKGIEVLGDIVRGLATQGLRPPLRPFPKRGNENRTPKTMKISALASSPTESLLKTSLPEIAYLMG